MTEGNFLKCLPISDLADELGFPFLSCQLEATDAIVCNFIYETEFAVLNSFFLSNSRLCNKE